MIDLPIRRIRVASGVGATVCFFIAAGCLLAADETFESMFDGKTLAGWTVAPAKCAADWTVESGTIIGNTEQRGSYLVWTGGGDLVDFEIRLSYRVLSEKANSGIH